MPDIKGQIFYDSTLDIKYLKLAYPWRQKVDYRLSGPKGGKNGSH